MPKEDLTTEELVHQFFEDHPNGFYKQEELAQKLDRDQSSISRTISTLKSEGYLREIVIIDGKARFHCIGRKYEPKSLKRLALRYWVGPNLYEYVFGFDLRRLLRIARISQARLVEDQLRGFQRGEQRTWINELTSKLNVQTSFVTDPVTVCLDKNMVEWTAIDIGDANIVKSGFIHQPEFGILSIPYSENFSEDEKPAILIDGQQRSLAATKTDRDNIPILITGYVEDLSNERFLLDEFIKNNSHKNLPSELLDVLAPHASEEVLPRHIKARLPADQVAAQLNMDPNSPFYKRIKTSVNPQGIIVLRSVVQMIRNSQRSGFLQPLSAEEQRAALNAYWTAVARVFPDAWKEPPSESKLTHGSGMYAMGQLMDQVLPRVMDQLWTPSAVPAIETELRRIADKCIWTEPIDPIKRAEWESEWEPLQNLKRHKDELAKRLKWFYLGR